MTFAHFDKREYKTGMRTLYNDISTENQNQESFYPYVQHEISVLIELPLGHLCCLLTDVPPSQTPQHTMFLT